MERARSDLKVTASDALEFEPVAQTATRKAGRMLRNFLFVAIAVGGGAAGWAFYGERVLALFKDPETEIPLVRADPSPIKVRPENPGGMQIPDRDKLVYNRIKGGDAAEQASARVETLLPPPEKPLPKPRGVIEPPPASQAVAAMEVPATEPKSTISEVPKVSDVTSAEPPTPPPPAPSSGTSTLKTAAKLAAPAAPAPDPIPAKPVQLAKKVPAPPPAAPAVKTAPKKASATPGFGKEVYRVQLAAARTSDAARKEWDRLRRLNLDLLGDLGLRVTKVDLGGTKGVFYRLRVGPLDGQKEARKLCRELAKRKIGCLVVRPGK